MKANVGYMCLVGHSVFNMDQKRPFPCCQTSSGWCCELTAVCKTLRMSAVQLLLRVVQLLFPAIVGWCGVIGKHQERNVRVSLGVKYVIVEVNWVRLIGPET